MTPWPNSESNVSLRGDEETSERPRALPMCHGTVQCSNWCSQVSVTLVVGSRHVARGRMHAYPRRYRRHARLDEARRAARRDTARRGAARCGTGATRLLQTALSTWFLNAPPFMFTIPSTARPPFAAPSHTRPLFLPIGKVNSRRVSPVITRTQIGFIHGQLSCTRIRAPRSNPETFAFRNEQYGATGARLLPNT